MKRPILRIATGRPLDLALLVLVCIAAGSHWYVPELPRGHDALASLSGAAMVKDALGSLGVTRALAGFGSMDGYYLGPLSLGYLLVPLSWTMSWMAAGKTVFMLLFAGSAVSAYLLAHELTGSRPASFVAALAYAFAPVYFIEVVFEGHWSIGAQYMLTPLLFLATDKTLQRPGPGRAALAGLALALLILLGHPQSFPLLVGPFLVVFMLFRLWQYRHDRPGVRAVACLFTILAGLSLTAFWWMPLLSEARYFHGTYSSMEEAGIYSANFGQAVTLRPVLCCSTGSAFGESGNAWVGVLQTFPAVLAVLGIAANRRNRHVWVFAALAVLSLVLALKPSSPGSPFWFARSFLPFFEWIRTPSRFLIFTAFAYAMLAGFCTRAAVDWLGRLRLQPRAIMAAPLALGILLSTLTVGNAWPEAREGLTTFTLPADKAESLSFLAAQANGEYRVADATFELEAFYPETGAIVDPAYWTFAHGKDTVPGGLPQTTTYAADAVAGLRAALAQSTVDLSGWLSVFNVKYAIVDRSNPLASRLLLNDDFERVFTTASVDVYENHAMLPRLFTITESNERPVGLWSGDNVTVILTPDGANPAVSPAVEHARSSDRTLRATYEFAASLPDPAGLLVDVQDIRFSADDAVRLAFYSDTALPDVSLRLDLLESDGSRYGMEAFRTDGIQAGWNDLCLPLSMLVPGDAADENGRLDPDQVRALSFGPVRGDSGEEAHRFSLYYDSLSVTDQQTGTTVEYTRVRPGRYEVEVHLDAASHLVLSEYFHPGWVARGDGETIHSRMAYESLNSFYLEPGDHRLTIEFTTSPLRTAGNVISWTACAAVCSAAGYRLFDKWRRTRYSLWRRPAPPGQDS